MDIQKNTLHLSKADNPDVEEYMSTKSAGDTCEITVTAQIREITEEGVVLDVTSADALDFSEPLGPEESATSESIAAVMGGE